MAYYSKRYGIYLVRDSLMSHGRPTAMVEGLVHCAPSSPYAGTGVVASRDFAAGEDVLICTGVYMHTDVPQRASERLYTYELNEPHKPTSIGCLCMANTEANIAMYINTADSSSTQNCAVIEDGLLLVIRTIKRIKQGEELLVMYKVRAWVQQLPGPVQTNLSLLGARRRRRRRRIRSRPRPHRTARCAWATGLFQFQGCACAHARPTAPAGHGGGQQEEEGGL